MKAMILGAGKGTRMRPITYFIPKPMVPIVEKPVMELLLELLKKHGCDRIMINTGYLAKEIENYFRDGHQWGIEIGYSFEGYYEGDRPAAKTLGSAGGMKKIQDFSGFFDETFVVVCGDALIDLNITEVLKFHQHKKSLATIVLQEVPWEKVSSYGVVVTDKNNSVKTFQEKPSQTEALSNKVNTGIYIFEPEIFNYIPSNCVYDIASDLFPNLLQKGLPLYGVTKNFTWIDIGKTPDCYAAIQKVMRGELSGIKPPGKEIKPGIWTGINVSMNLDKLDLKPPIYIGSSSKISDGTKIIGPSVIKGGCIIEPDCIIDRAIVTDRTHLARGTILKECFVNGHYFVKATEEKPKLEIVDTNWFVGDLNKNVRSKMTV